MGATLGMAAGLLVTFSYMTHTQPWLREWVLGISRSEPITLWWGIQPIAAGVFGAPVAFLTIIVVSLLTPPPDRATLALVDYLRQRGGRAAGREQLARGGCCGAQWETDFEKTFITTTPAMMRPMPIIAGASRCCLKSSALTMEMSTMPTPDQIA